MSRDPIQDRGVQRRPSEARFAKREPMSQARIDTARAYVSTQVCYLFLGNLFTEGRPLDRELSRFFREEKRFGSHDRRLISESLFSLTRWWGWVRKLVPSPNEEQWTTLSREKIMQQPKWFLPLLAARLLDGQHAEGPIQVWAKANKIETQDVKWGGLSLKEKAVELSELFNINVLSIPALFPPFINEELPETCDLLQLQEAMQVRPPMWLRIQNENISEVIESLRQDGLEVKQHAFVKTALELNNPRVNLYETQAYQKGWIEIQDLASQGVGLVCSPKAGERWLDFCAGAGGKTLQLASLMKNKGTIVAVDKRNWKLEDLRKRAKRAGFDNIIVKQSEGEFPKEKNGAFDGVLVDAPCSCTGTWRRNPDARWTTTLEQIDELVTLQKEILTRAQKAVKNRGVLIYATCSFTQRENEAMVAWFLAEHPQFEMFEIPHPFTSEKQVNGYVRIMPYENNTDAMFIAKFQKKEGV